MHCLAVLLEASRYTYLTFNVHFPTVWQHLKFVLLLNIAIRAYLTKNAAYCIHVQRLHKLKYV